MTKARTSHDMHSLSALLDEVSALAGRSGSVSVGDLHRLVGVRGFGPFILLLGLAALTPLGVIPLLPTFLAVVVLLLAGQIVIGRRRLWLPDAFEQRSLSAARLGSVTRRLRKPALILERLIHPRMELFARSPFDRIVAGLCILTAFAIPPLELVPFGVAAPATTLTVFGLALTARDGLLILLACFGAAVALATAGINLAG